jgi:hypothetical protein
MRPSKNQCVALGRRQNRVVLLASLAVFLVGVMAAVPAPVQAASKITQLLVGEKTDAAGAVSKHQDTFAPTTASIKGTALITGMEKGQKVTADLIYGPENLKALTITKDISGTGDVTLTFAFSKPTNNWPPGNYKVVVTTSDGVTDSVPFQVK